MKLDALQKKLLAAAKATPPSDRVPLAFEHRVLAHLKTAPPRDVSALWARALWQAVVPCVAVTIVLLGVSLLPNATKPDSSGDVDLSQAFEQTLLAASEQTTEEIW